jgi:hypothetical protein
MLQNFMQNMQNENGLFRVTGKCLFLFNIKVVGEVVMARCSKINSLTQGEGK